jgi:hypothetical protein
VARIQAKIEVDQKSFAAADALLAKLAIQVRSKTVDAAMRKVGNAVKSQTRAILPRPGYPGDKPELKPLRDTLRVKVKNYAGGDIKVMLVGYTYSRIKGQGGNHGHLLEGGHDMVVGGSKKDGGKVVGFVQPREYLIRIAETTRQAQRATFVAAIEKAVKVT